MKKNLAMFFSGLIVPVVAVFVSRWVLRQTEERDSGPGEEVQKLVDLNLSSAEELHGLGLEADTVERIVENRPYRSKLELVSRVMLPNDVYSGIKDRVGVAASDEPVKIAS